jgi:hypothetical protein
MHGHLPNTVFAYSRTHLQLVVFGKSAKYIVIVFGKSAKYIVITDILIIIILPPQTYVAQLLLEFSTDFLQIFRLGQDWVKDVQCKFLGQNFMFFCC